MPAQRTTKKQQPAQQPLLGFNARSRASSTSAVKKQPAPSSSIKSRSTKASRTKAAAVVELDSSSSSSETNGDGIVDAEEALAELEGRKKTSDRKGSQVVQPAAGDELKPNDPKWNKAYKEARAHLGGQKPIHHEEEPKVATILRVFDNDTRFGPSTSIDRLARWERANKWGLNPPAYVKEILVTKQGKEDVEIKETVFYGRV